MRQQTAVAHHRHQMRRDGFAGERLAGAEVFDLPRLGVYAHPVPVPNPPRVIAYHCRKAEVEGVAVKEAGERLRDQGDDAEVLERRGRLLARGAGAEVASRHDDVTRPHRGGERRVQCFEAVLGHLLDRELHVAARGEHVRIDVVAEYPRPHASISRGSHTRPATADAATVYGEARETCADAAPMRPLKFRAVVEIATAFSGSRCSP